MRVLMFAGTSEGRRLASAIKKRRDIEILVCVATEYGKEVLQKESLEGKNCKVHSGRLDENDMEELMKEGFSCVIDATHPYAKIVSQNIKAAAEKVNLEYVRLLRDKTDFSGEDYILLKDTKAVTEYLNEVEGNVLLTVGSKELSAYSQLQKKTGKMFARVLPLANVICECNENGFSGKNLICMQGPFSKDLNIAMLKQYDCKYLVTKDTGKAGGADEKYEAAKEAGAKLIVVGRTQETGLSYEQVLKKFEILENEEEDNNEENTAEKSILCTHFPMFFDIKGKNIAVLGAGKIAKRRIEALLKFDCNIKIIAKEVSHEIEELVNGEKKASCNDRKIEILQREMRKEDFDNLYALILATNNRDVNRAFAEEAKRKGILVNTADTKELCDFYFPGIAIEGDLVAGVTAQGRNHALARKAASEVRKLFKEAKGWEEK